MVAVSALPPVRPPALAEATKRSTTLWQENLQELFKHAKDRFPDVVWDLIDENADDGETEEVWGHKGSSHQSTLIFILVDPTRFIPLYIFR